VAFGIDPKILIDNVMKILESRGGVMINAPKANPVFPSGTWIPAKNNKDKK